jgi:2-polyprenyl-3-methyl-5-hydroxy-6-metoxy-1,4-benzoquinol methylase
MKFKHNCETESLSNCIGCGGHRLKTLLPATERIIFVTDGTEMTVQVGVAGCTDCGFIFLNPRMGHKALELYYSKQSRLPRKDIDPESPFSRLMAIQSDYIKSHKDLTPNASVLEVGCAEGFFLNYLNRMVVGGLQIFGSEPSRRYAEFASSLMPQANIYEVPFERAPLKHGGFDFIIARHVLEHLSNPLESLGRMRSLVTPEGAIYIEVPDTASITPAISDFFHHEHLSYFTEETLTAILARNNLRLLDVERFKHNPAGSGFSYPVIRTLAVPDSSVTVSDVPAQFDIVWDNYIKAADAFCRERLDPIRARLFELKSKSARTALFGAGPHTMDLIKRFNFSSFPWSIIFDNNPNKAGKKMMGIPIEAPTAKALLNVDCVLISSAEFEGEMVAQVRSLAGPEIEIITIYKGEHDYASV